LSDLPWEGIPLRIELRVRRFFCDTEDCGQQIFTERLPKTVQRYARRTCRLSTSLEQITLALGGAAGSRLAQQLGILASGSTLLRQLRRRVMTLSADAPRVLGIDDWAWRKGRRYGTILCDLERGKVVDLLPDRSTESTAQWLRAHPGTEIVSRDRASLYADAATRAAPHAVQVADRWHLLHNLSEALIGALALSTNIATISCSAGNRDVAMARNFGASCVSRDLMGNPAPSATGSGSIAVHKNNGRNEAPKSLRLCELPRDRLRGYY
jgi:transposase